VLKFSQHTRNGQGAYSNGRVHTVWQKIDVTGVDFLEISALGIANTENFSGGVNASTLRFGLSTIKPENNHHYVTNNINDATLAANATSSNASTSIFDLFDVNGNAGYVEWTGPATVGSNTSTETAFNIIVGGQTIIYAVIVSFVDFTSPDDQNSASNQQNLGSTGIDTDNDGLPDSGDGVPMQANSIDNLLIVRGTASDNLMAKVGNEKNSSTWNSYKSGTPSENQDDYQDDTYWPMDGSRFGLDPQHAQANGSFYMDNRLGKIHFSSNITGKTVILDYISDSLGTDGEMQVHKFAEEAMYRYILHGIASGRIQTQQLVPRLKKEKFAAIRQAKLRLSSIKLEEITQILRGKSKQIKH